MADQRIVSLLPSATEIVSSLGFKEGLVGRSHECDFPPGIAHLPVCTEPKFDPRGSSRDIDRQVKALLEEALSVYRVHADLLRRLKPGLIVTQSQCEVCAVSETDLIDVVESWVDSRPQLVSLNPETLEGIYSDIMRVGIALDAEGAGYATVAGMKERMAEIAERAERLDERPRVACTEWVDPLMAAGNWMPELVEQAGGHNLFGVTGRHSPWLDWGEVEAADPDVIVVLPCGLDIGRTRSEMATMTALPGWRGLRAVKNQRVYVTDGHHYFNRPGARLVESLEILAEILHPGVFGFGHEGRGWSVYPTA